MAGWGGWKASRGVLFEPGLTLTLPPPLSHGREYGVMRRFILSKHPSPPSFKVKVGELLQRTSQRNPPYEECSRQPPPQSVFE